jgi:hypothetical protein
MTGTELAAMAEDLVNVKWKRQGRTLNGLDCAGVLIRTCKDAQLVPATFDFLGYDEVPAHGVLESIVSRFAQPLRKNQVVRVGMIGLYRIQGRINHGGIFVPAGIVHASFPSKKVVRHGVRGMWVTDLAAVYCLDGVDYSEAAPIETLKGWKWTGS